MASTSLTNTVGPYGRPTEIKIRIVVILNNHGNRFELKSVKKSEMNSSSQSFNPEEKIQL